MALLVDSGHTGDHEKIGSGSFGVMFSMDRGVE
jgi:hypothetical protein